MTIPLQNLAGYPVSVDSRSPRYALLASLAICSGSFVEGIVANCATVVTGDCPEPLGRGLAEVRKSSREEVVCEVDIVPD